MMRSESTRALGHPRLTNPTFGWRRLMRGRYGMQQQLFFQRETTKMTKSWMYGAATVLAVHVLWMGLILIEAHLGWVMGAIIVMLFVTMNIAGLGAFITAF